VVLVARQIVHAELSDRVPEAMRNYVFSYTETRWHMKLICTKKCYYASAFVSGVTHWTLLARLTFVMARVCL